MSARIGATISGVELRLLNQLNQANTAAATNALRLATGEKINAPKDDPSGFVALDNFRNQRARVTSALTNVTEASSVVSQSQLALDQIRTQLTAIRALAVADEDGALTAGQRTANQAAIDTALDAISTLVNTSVNGRRVLDGSAEFQVSGVDNTQIDDVLPISLGPNESKTLSGSVGVAATRGSVTHIEGSGTISNTATFTLAGTRGETSIAVTIGESLADVATRVNSDSHLTGVTAAVSGGTNLVFTSVEYGSDATVTTTTTAGTFTENSSSGTDATATINGRALVGNGNRFTVADNGFTAQVEFAAGFSGTFASVTIGGDALRFSLTTDPGRISALSIPGLQTSRLGGASGTLDQLAGGGTLSGLAGNTSRAIRVIDEALGRLTVVDGIVDGFADAAIVSSSNLLEAFDEDLEFSIDSINLVDEDAEELLESKNLALAGNAIAGLAIIESQRNSILALIRRIAGFSA